MNFVIVILRRVILLIKLFLIIIIIIILVKCYQEKIKIKWKTFLQKGFEVKRGIFGIYCYCGFQGEGKTYSCVEYVHDNEFNINLFSNVHIEKPQCPYIEFSGFKEMLELRDLIDLARLREESYIIFKNEKYYIDFKKQVLFIYDEIFSELQRGSKLSTDVLDFITQMRKRGFILLTTAQVWSDIPITWRRLTRYQIDCSMKNLFFTNILIKRFYDAEQMKWSNDDQEFIAPIISTTISHTRKCISSRYDTYQLIHNKNSSFNSSS